MTEQEAFEHVIATTKLMDPIDAWKAACEWQRSVCNEELLMLRKRVAELEANVARRDRDLAYWETVRRELVEDHEKELAALKQQGDSVAWMHTSGNACYCGKDLKIDGYTIPLYTAPPACFSAGDMADQAAKRFRDGRAIGYEEGYDAACVDTGVRP